MQAKITEISMRGIRVDTDSVLIEICFVCVCVCGEELLMKSNAIWERRCCCICFQSHTRRKTKPPPQHAIFRKTLKMLVAGHADTDGTYLATADTF